MPVFSIIIPTFNSAETIQNCLESVLSQQFTNFEVLIIDGVSTDNTIEIVKNVNDSRITILSEPDKGIYDAMNKGIKLAKGEWLYFLGSDDSLYNKHILNIIFLNKNIRNLDIIYGNVYSLFHGGIYNGKWSIEKIGYNLCHQSIFYKKKTLFKLGNFNIKYRVSADHDINIKWFLNKKIKHQYINEIIANFSEGGFSSTQIDNEFDFNMNYIIFKRGIGLLELEDLKEYAARAYFDKRREEKSTICFFLKFSVYSLRTILYIKKKLNN